MTHSLTSSKFLLSEQSLLSGGLPGSKMPSADDLGFYFNGDYILTSHEGQCVFPFNHVYPDLTDIIQHNPLFIGEWEGKSLFACVVERCIVEKNAQFQFNHGRDVLNMVDAQTSYALCRAKQLLYWHLSSLFCGSCGQATTFSQVEAAKCCDNCHKMIFPSAFPAVIVLIVKGAEILLSRSRNFPAGMYSTMAGFVDAGESLEAAIHREIKEELGIRVKDIKYFGSQSWPFPNSLMIGFQAEYDRGELCIDKNEIEDAGWFTASELPLLPPQSSIARNLIDSYFSY